MKYDIFISYSRKDSAIVNRFKNELSAAGYKIWMDIDGIESGDEFKRKIVAAIRESNVFVFFSSVASNESEWTVKEVNYAIKRKIHIIPVKLDEAEYNESVDFDLCAVDFVDCMSPKGFHKAVDKLLRSLRSKIAPCADNGIPVADVVQEEKVPEQIPVPKTASEGSCKQEPLVNSAGSVSSKSKLIYFAPLLLILIVGAGIWMFGKNGDSASRENAAYPQPSLLPQQENHAEGVLDSGKAVAESGDALYSKGDSAYSCGNLEEAVRWYRMAAEQGHAKAQFSLGCCYENGEGVPQSAETAVEWWRKAAEQGDLESQFDLGVCYVRGEGVPQSFEEAAKWWHKVAEQGHAEAQYNLGWCYYYGNGVPQSADEAVKWWRKAAELGDADAIDALEKLGV